MKKIEKVKYGAYTSDHVNFCLSQISGLLSLPMFQKLKKARRKTKKECFMGFFFVRSEKACKRLSSTFLPLHKTP